MLRSNGKIPTDNSFSLGVTTKKRGAKKSSENATEAFLFVDKYATEVITRGKLSVKNKSIQCIPRSRLVSFHNMKTHNLNSKRICPPEVAWILEDINLICEIFLM